MRAIHFLPSVCLCLVALVACGGASEPQGHNPGRGEPVEFSLPGIDGAPVDARSLQGRVTVILFATTFDISSQAQARRLEDLYRSHAPRINALLVVLEPAKNVELVRSFRDVLSLSYPVAQVDPRGLSGEGVFDHVRSVPTWMILDRQGRLGFLVGGQLGPEQLAEAVSKFE